MMMPTTQPTMLKEEKCTQTQKEDCVPTEEALGGITNSERNSVLHRVVTDLRTAQHEFGSNHNSVAEAWNALGLVRIHMQRDVEAAQVCHEEALRIYSENLQQTDTALTLNDLGYCHEQQGNPSVALDHYEKALRILSNMELDESHPRVISTHRAVSRIRRA
jgi:tetratricopeptide (TPR) repeat protein